MEQGTPPKTGNAKKSNGAPFLYTRHGWFFSSSKNRPINSDKGISPRRSAISLAVERAIPAAFEKIKSASFSSFDDALLEQLRELFFYLNSFCYQYPFSHGLFTGSLRIAHFVGCRLECDPLPFDEHCLDSKEQTRLAAFLLCVFLTLRRRIDELYAELYADSAPLFRYRICAVTRSEDFLCDRSSNETVDVPDFLSLSCFRDFQFSVSDGSIRFDALLFQSPSFVNSVDTAQMCLSIVFDVD